MNAFKWIHWGLLYSSLIGGICHADPAPQSTQIQAQPDTARSGSVKTISGKNIHAKPIQIGPYRGLQVAIPGSHALATPAIADGRLFLGGGFGSREFYAFDARSLHPLWALSLSDDGPTAAVIKDGLVVFNTESCTLFVVQADSGKHVWSRWLGDPLMSQPAIADGRIYMAFPGNDGHKLAAFDLRNGHPIWSAPIAGDIISAPVVDQKSLYLASFDGMIYKFNASTGALDWKEDYQATSAPWLQHDMVYVSKREAFANPAAGSSTPVTASPNETITRFNKHQGVASERKLRSKSAPYLNAEVQEKSRYYGSQKSADSAVGFSSAPATAKTLDAKSNIGQSTVAGLWEFQGSRPLLYAGVLYSVQGDEVVALEPEHEKELWRHPLPGDLQTLGGHLAAPPAPAGDKLYLATVTGRILILNRNDGRLEQTLDVKHPLRFQPALMHGRLYVGTADGYLISLDLSDASADGWPMWGGGPGHNGNESSAIPK